METVYISYLLLRMASVSCSGNLIKHVTLLQSSRTYQLNDDPFKYIINLEGSPAVDSNDCINTVVCQTHVDNTKYYASLGEKDTETFFIKGNILIIHLTC